MTLLRGLKEGYVGADLNCIVEPYELICHLRCCLLNIQLPIAMPLDQLLPPNSIARFRLSIIFLTDCEELSSICPIVVPCFLSPSASVRVWHTANVLFMAYQLGMPN